MAKKKFLYLNHLFAFGSCLTVVDRRQDVSESYTTQVLFPPLTCTKHDWLSEDHVTAR
jgi:hypothetical protein